MEKEVGKMKYHPRAKNYFWLLLKSLGGHSSSADRFTHLRYFQIPNTPRVSLGVSKEQRFKTRLLRMCPLRIILIFLSASLAGLLAWRTFCSKERVTVEEKDLQSKISYQKSPPASLAWDKVVFAFWTLVDMGSGRYLWRNLISNRDSYKPKAY